MIKIENNSQNNSVGELNHENGVKCENVYFKYKYKNYILNGVNLNVNKGKIYGLLGPSGCGKTSLLRCILGIKKPSFGRIKLFKMKPNDKLLKIPGPNVGYMPQELALYNDLTIYEMLVYTGKIFQMKNDLINQRIFELMNFLDLSQPHIYIKFLSGGQQRRVSFAAAIIHYPKLIILDEPTAGVDPLLRERIWNALIEMKKKLNVTFIITTHYIEESRRAEKVGFMRKGRILCEDEPSVLLKKYHSNTLENVFLKICTKTKPNSINTLEKHDEINFRQTCKDNQTFENSIELKNKTSPSSLKMFHFEKMLIFLNILKALIRKNLFQDLRDPLQISFQYISPIAQVLLFAFCIGRNPIGIKLGVYTNEFSFLNFSSKYLNVIDNEFIELSYYKNYSQAIEDVKKTKLWGVMSFNKYYSHSFMERFAYNVSDIAIKNSTIIINPDITNKIITDLTFKQLAKYYGKFVKIEFERYYIESKYATSYIEYPEIVYGKINDIHYTGYRNFMLPGIIINLTFAMAIAITSIRLINEKNSQTMERTYVSGVTSSQIIISHIIGRIILSLPYAFLVLLMLIVIFQFPQNGSLILATMIVLLQNIFGMICGLIVASLSKSLIMSMVATSGSFMITLFVSGTLWPIEAISTKLRWFAYILPTTLATEALRSVTLRGWTIQNFYIWISLIVSSVWIFILSIIGFKLFKLNQ